jgi:hypothetical protein
MNNNRIDIINFPEQAYSNQKNLVIFLFKKNQILQIRNFTHLLVRQIREKMKNFHYSMKCKKSIQSIRMIQKWSLIGNSVKYIENFKDSNNQ